MLHYVYRLEGQCQLATPRLKHDKTIQNIQSWCSILPHREAHVSIRKQFASHKFREQSKEAGVKHPVRPVHPVATRQGDHEQLAQSMKIVIQLHRQLLLGLGGMCPKLCPHLRQLSGLKQTSEAACVIIQPAGIKALYIGLLSAEQVLGELEI